MSKKTLFLVFITMICTVFIGVSSTFAAREKREVQSFHSINLKGVGTVYLSQGEEESLTVEADDEIIKDAKSFVMYGTLHLYYDDPNSIRNVIFGNGSTINRTTVKNEVPSNNAPNITYKLVVKDLRKIELSGACSVQGNGKLTVDNLAIQKSGVGNIKLNLEAYKLSTSLSGAGEIALSGKAHFHGISLSSAGKLDGFGLCTDITTVFLSGTGNAEVWATNNLNASISGVGKVIYKGNPKLISKEISGYGQLVSEDGTKVFENKSVSGTVVRNSGNWFMHVGGNRDINIGNVSYKGN